eukprot:11965270-Alexandrium_andersonii.AAC.2
MPRRELDPDVLADAHPDASPLPALTHPNGAFPMIEVGSLDSAFRWCRHALDRAAAIIGIDKTCRLISNREITTSSSFSGVSTDLVASDIISSTFNNFLRERAPKHALESEEG